jgi:hypothetical protein
VSYLGFLCFYCFVERVSIFCNVHHYGFLIKRVTFFVFYGAAERNPYSVIIYHDHSLPECISFVHVNRLAEQLGVNLGKLLSNLVNDSIFIEQPVRICFLFSDGCERCGVLECSFD